VTLDAVLEDMQVIKEEKLKL